MLRVGLTGGIGCGKSTVAEILREHDCRVLDADALARDLSEPGQPAHKEIVAAFGPEILSASRRDLLGCARPCYRARDQKNRPGLVVSPDEMNQALGTVVLAPITSTIRDFPTRYTIRLQRRTASVALDQIRTVSRERLLKKITAVDPKPALAILREIFAD